MTIDEAKDHVGWPVRIQESVDSDIKNKRLLTNMGVSADGIVTVVDADQVKYLVKCDDLMLAKEQVKVSAFNNETNRNLRAMMGKIRNFITCDQFKRLHEVCPKCGNGKLRSTLIDYAQRVGRDYEDRNKVWCEEENGGCGWKGTRMDLVPRKVESKNY
jgi:uncharacterized protein with PIN domain